MEDREVKLAQYSYYLKSKDDFVDRSFQVNRFFIVLNIALLAGLIIFDKFSFDEYITATLIISSLGAVVSLLYLGSIDAYNVLIKIKLKDVIEQLEQEFPLQIHAKEKEAIDKWKKESKSFFFTDLQKLLAYLFLLIFAGSFLHEIVPFIMYTFKLF